MRLRISPYFTVTAVILLSTFLVWLPFLLHAPNWFGIPIERSSFDYIYKHFDGPLYIIPAKTLYNPNLIDIPNKGLIISFPLSAGYFAAHLPLYPVFIRAFAYLFGYLKSLILVNVFFSVLLGLFFYYFVTKLRLTKNPLLATMVFLFLPRFLVLRSVGSPESLFMLLVISSLYFFEKEKYLWAGLLGGLAATTKVPGVLLSVAYSFVFIEKFLQSRKIELRWFWILLIPLGLVSVFAWYQLQYHDFFAYFHTAAVVPMPYPFAAFNSHARWVDTGWLEDVILYFFLYLLAVLKLKDSPRRGLFYFALVYFVAATFIQHRDISRYSLPLWPLAVVAFEEFFTSKKFFDSSGHFADWYLYVFMELRGL